jgi:hypothetical protein
LPEKKGSLCRSGVLSSVSRACSTCRDSREQTYASPYFRQTPCHFRKGIQAGHQFPQLVSAALPEKKGSLCRFGVSSSACRACSTCRDSREQTYASPYFRQTPNPFRKGIHSLLQFPSSTAMRFEMDRKSAETAFPFCLVVFLKEQILRCLAAPKRIFSVCYILFRGADILKSGGRLISLCP